MGTETPLARPLEEMLCIDLLHHWAERAGVELRHGARAAAPRHVREAEMLMESPAKEAPTIGEVARQVGVSARTLSDGFLRLRGVSPRDFLRDQRLDGLQKSLLAAVPGDKVPSVAGAWGSVNFGAMAGHYRARFGERPSATLARAPIARKSTSDIEQPLPKPNSSKVSLPALSSSTVNLGRIRWSNMHSKSMQS